MTFDQIRVDEEYMHPSLICQHKPAAAVSMGQPISHDDDAAAAPLTSTPSGPVCLRWRPMNDSGAARTSIETSLRIHNGTRAMS